MPNNWKKYKLSEIAEIKYGKDHKHIASGNIPIYGSGGIMRLGDTALYEEESILIPRKGTLSNLFYVNSPFWSVDTMFYTKIKSGVNAKYLYYNLKTLDLASMDVGSAVPSLTTELLNRIEILLPELKEQQAIAEILSSLDDKIELNLQTNKTLEEMANALYKHWFVDFGPFLPSGRCPQDGRGPIPGFVESELGLIPEGWEVKRLGDIITHQKGFAFKSNWYQAEGKLVVRISDTTEDSINISSCNKISNDLAASYATYELKTNDVIIATVGSWPPNYSSVVGKVVKVPSIAEGSLLNQNAVRLTMTFKERTHQGLLYFTLKNERFLKYIINCAQGSANQASIKLTDIFDYPIPFGSVDRLIDLSKQFDLLIEKQNILINENHTLKQTRDYLLPKLISGEIQVKDALKKVKAIV